MHTCNIFVLFNYFLCIIYSWAIYCQKIVLIAARASSEWVSSALWNPFKLCLLHKRFQTRFSSVSFFLFSFSFSFPFLFSLNRLSVHSSLCFVCCAFFLWLSGVLCHAKLLMFASRRYQWLDPRENTSEISLLTTTVVSDESRMT